MAQKGKSTKTGYLSWGEYEKLCTHLRGKKNREWLLLFVTIGCNVALRASDMLRLRWHDVFQQDVLLLFEKKTGKARRMVLNDNVKSVVSECYNGQDLSELLFLNRAGELMTIQYINRVLKKEINECGIFVSGNVSSHLMRKTFGRRVMEQKNYDPQALILLMDAFGHSSPNITKTYLGIRQDEVDEVYNLVV